MRERVNMSNKHLSKELSDHLISDNPILWIMEARAFLESANILEHAPIPLEKIPLLKGKRPTSSPEISRNSYKNKITCFLYAISIELFLKSIYSATKDKDTTRSNR